MAHDAADNSSLPPRNFPKATLTVDTASYMGFDVAQHDIDDDVILVIRGRIKGKRAHPMEKGELIADIAVIDIQDQTARKDRDETNRLI